MKPSTLLSACRHAGICLVLLLSAHASHGQTVKTIELNYSEKDFEYRKDNSGRLLITSYKYSTAYDTNPFANALPYLTANILIEKEQYVENYSFQTNESVIMNEVELALVPQIQATGNFPFLINETNNHECKKNCEFMGVHTYGNYKLLNFRLCPYRYDSSLRKLYFINTFYITIYFKNSLNCKIEKRNIYRTMKSSNQKDLMKDLVKKVIVNPEELKTGKSILEDNSIFLDRTNNDYCDYVIITSNSLASNFQPLADWKTQKGIKTRVVSTDYIYNNYIGETNQLKIKRFLQDYYINQGLQYALLGGDDTLVPSQGCVGVVSLFGIDCDLHIPTDLFYSAFGGQFDWNYDGNDLLGENSDSVCIDPSIFLTRIPVRTTTDVDIFVNRILNYEKNPPIETWKDSMLMCSAKFYNMYYSGSDSICDNYYKGETMYEEYISPYWNGNLTHLYETKTATQTNTSNLTPMKLQQEIEKGYPFIEVLTHGSQTAWAMPESAEYTCSHAASLQNDWPTIITTTACSTNAFDSQYINYLQDPCLSEAFLRNPNSGIIAYMGCSRASWDYVDTDLGPISLIDAEFYKCLFKDSLEENNYSRMATLAEMSIVGKFWRQYVNWVLYAHNPLGDPEMPIFHSRPKVFSSVKLLWNENGITVKPGLENTRVCLMSLPDKGETYYEVKYPSTNTSFVNIPDSFSICITKQGYIPYIVNMSRNSIVRYIQNETITQDKSYSGITIEVGSDVTDNKAHGPVVINSGNVFIDGSQSVFIKNDFEVQIGASLIINDF